MSFCGVALRERIGLAEVLRGGLGASALPVVTATIGKLAAITVVLAGSARAFFETVLEAARDGA